MFKLILNWLTGGVLDRILTTVDTSINNETQRESIKAEVTKSYVLAMLETNKADKWLSIWRGMFVVPTGIYYSAIILDSLFHWDWNVAALPAPYDTWGAAIVLALFAADGLVTAAKQFAKR